MVLVWSQAQAKLFSVNVSYLKMLEIFFLRSTETFFWYTFRFFFSFRIGLAAGQCTEILLWPTFCFFLLVSRCCHATGQCRRYYFIERFFSISISDPGVCLTEVLWKNYTTDWSKFLIALPKKL